jgi:hypothetical protein
VIAAVASRPSSAVACALTLLALGTAGCHRATEADCEKILDRIVELELKDQGITDPKLVEIRKAETRASKREALIKSCVGKRISESALACIQNAREATEVTEKCLR